MEDTYYDYQGQFEEYFDGVYDPMQGGFYYEDDNLNYSYLRYMTPNEEFVGSCAGPVEENKHEWEEMVEACIHQLEESKEATNQRFQKLEVNVSILDAGLTSLCAQVSQMEQNLSTLATIIGNKHKPGQFPSLPQINPKGNCHAVQLRSGTSYEPPDASDIRKTKEAKGKEKLHQEDAAVPAEPQQRTAESPVSGPPKPDAIPVPFQRPADSSSSGPPANAEGSDISQWAAGHDLSGPPKPVRPYTHRLTRIKLGSPGF